MLFEQDISCSYVIFYKALVGLIGEKMRFRIAVFITALSLILGACAPTQAGSTAYFPVQATPQRTIALDAGLTYVATSYNPSLWSIPEDQINSVLGTVSGDADRYQQWRSPVNWMSLSNIQAPKDWKVGLAGANAKREVTNITSTTIYYSYAVELILSVEIPKGADLSGIITADVSHRNGRTAPIRLQVN